MSTQIHSLLVMGTAILRVTPGILVHHVSHAIVKLLNGGSITDRIAFVYINCPMPLFQDKCMCWVNYIHCKLMLCNSSLHVNEYSTALTMMAPPFQTLLPSLCIGSTTNYLNLKWDGTSKGASCQMTSSCKTAENHHFQHALPSSDLCPHFSIDHNHPSWACW